MLAASDYNGWLTLEWEKHWHSHIEDADVAFPGFVRYMRGLAERFDHRN
ncbi:MAG: hypothetical protein HN742_12385 [Lentisphaerae bacterium]|nr:hypothetical protein [Lentisphaerota bacterium]MBT4817681.1 hypothetical protein [Lentisphaerota bacterium]MBT5607208.1 hypothetical protein [Lentisphaerota bacterium]MBT7054454.1 hypothetical protein [Lentisphaerota bacterium]MBT7842666.1 hypothetical protein [Lentisphaerota bacterium]